MNNYRTLSKKEYLKTFTLTKKCCIKNSPW